jgi:N-formylglutamate deformylase
MIFFKSELNSVRLHKINFDQQVNPHWKKFWLLREGCCFDTEGLLHFRWAQKHHDFLKAVFGVNLDDSLKESEDEQEVCLSLLRQGMIRINHCRRKNSLTVEGCERYWDKDAQAFIRTVVANLPQDIVSVNINLFNAEATNHDAYFVNLFGTFDRVKRLRKWREVMDSCFNKIHPNPIIIHIPHASDKIPPGWKSDFNLNPNDLSEKLNIATNWFADELFSDPRPNFSTVICQFSPLLVDVIGFSDEACETTDPLTGEVSLRPLRGSEVQRIKPESQKINDLIEMYKSHQEKLTRLVEASLDQFGKALIVNGQSFPGNSLLPSEDDSVDEVSFCIGTDPYHTPNWLSELLKEALGSNQCRVSINYPISGTYVPYKYYQKDKRVLSVAIQVNRRVYMDEVRVKRDKGFNPTQEHINKILRQLAGVSRSKSKQNWG